MSQRICYSHNEGKEVSDCDTEIYYTESYSIENTYGAFAYVPFNSPQEGYANILPATDCSSSNTMFDEVSKTLSTLFCNDKWKEARNSQSECQVNNESAEIDNDRHFASEKCQYAGTNTDGVTNFVGEVNYSMDEAECAEKLSQCEISEHGTCTTGELRSAYSPSHQITFASQLELMPACVPNISDQAKNDEICRSKCSGTIQNSQSCSLDFVGQAENKLDDPMNVFGNVSSQNFLPNLMESIQTKSSDDCSMKNESMKNFMTQAYCQSDATRVFDQPAFECDHGDNSSHTEVHGLMETSHMHKNPVLSNVNDCDFTEWFERQLIADVNIIMDNLLENCCKVFGEEDKNANIIINQYATKPTDSGVNSLDIRVENESGLYLECTSLAKCLKTGSGHTNSSTINEANTSGLMKIGEPSADCQVPMTMPCHDNKQQEIEKSHENVAALALNSSQNDTCEVEQCIQASSQMIDSCVQFSQVSTNLMKKENIPSCISLSLQRGISENEMLNYEHLDAEGLKMNDPLILKHFPLKKDNLISRDDACGDQAEMQVPEISLQEPLLSSSDVSASDFHSDIAMIEEIIVRKEERCYEETALVSRREDIHIGENKLIEAYSRSEDFEKCSEIADGNGVDICSWHQCTKFKDFHHQNGHSDKDVECKREILHVETNDDISHSSSSPKAFNSDTLNGAPAIHTKTNENVMDLHGAGSQELLVEAVPESKNVVNRALVESSSITEENDLAETTLNNCLPQPGVLSENNRPVRDMQNMCSPCHQMRETALNSKPNVSEKANCYDQCEDYQPMSTQQFTASLSQVNIVDYLRDNRNTYDLQTDILGFPKDECSILNTEKDHIVPSELHTTSYVNGDVTLFDEPVNLLLKGKENAMLETVTQQSSCFQWKYAPSLNLDDIPVNVDSRHDEDSLLTVQLLKTCTRPIRVGLSKRYRAKPLHHRNVK